MKRQTKMIIITVLFILLLLLWAPWITEEYAIQKVTEKLGGPNAPFNYLGEGMTVKDIPKKYCVAALW